MIDFALTRDVVFRLISQQSLTEAALGKEVSRQLDLVLDKVINAEALNDQECCQAVELVRLLVNKLSLEQKREFKALIEQETAKQSITTIKKGALAEIQAILAG
ncbi:MAG: hypothetical protein PHC60_03490 [Heliobacteriaceae bacterium]|nr:hypothetical protein [Heliobacteriaceae bacterium]MDD4587444.1 hypothetical protein [Heliobacteriaceae bacterium]